MGAHRRVDAAGARELALGLGAHHLHVERLAHAVQALELVLTRAPRARHVMDRRERLRVVGGELRIHRLGRGEEPACAGEVGHVGVDLAGVHRVIVQALYLRALDLRIPVRALHQPHHQPVAARACEVDEEIHHERAALLVRLGDEAHAIPAGELRLVAEPLEQIEGRLEAIGLFRVDVDADVEEPRAQHEIPQAWVELLHHPLALRERVARMQRRELDGDARAVEDAASGAVRADGVDGALVRAEIALRIGPGHRRLAQHVVRVAEAHRLVAARVVERLGDGFPGDELPPHQTHAEVDRLADHRLAELCRDARERAREAALVVGGHEPAGHEQAPRGGIHERRGAAADVGPPVATADLVADERVARGGIGNAQQRLGEAHERHALVARERELLQQALHHVLARSARRAGAQAFCQPAREPRSGRSLFRTEGRERQQRLHALRLRAPPRRGDREAQR